LPRHLVEDRLHRVGQELAARDLAALAVFVPENIT